MILMLLCIGSLLPAQDWASEEYWENLSYEYLQNDLIAGTIDVHARGEYGETPLMFAAVYNQNPDVITALINAGADVNARDEYGWTPLMEATSNNKNPEIITTDLASKIRTIR